MNGDALLIGYGNTLREDDGLGPHVADRLAADLLPAARRIACHELTPELAAPIAAAGRVIFVDASVAAPPGAIRCAPLAPPPQPGAFSHAGTPAGLLGLARDLYGAAPPAWLLSMGGAAFDYGEGLSAAVLAALPRLRARLEALLGAGGPGATEATDARIRGG